MESARFVRQLGRGGFGTVDLVEVATPSGGSVCVARKTLNTKGKDAGQMEDALLREVYGGVAAARRSPFAPAVVGMTTGQEGQCIFTEFADGGSLWEVLKGRARSSSRSSKRSKAKQPQEQLALPLSELRKIAFSVLHALRAMNAKGYAHLDVKPENVLISGSMYLLTDFGTATELGEEGKVLDVCGTALFIAPEQFGSGFCRTSADCYSLGVTMAECAAWPADRVSLWEFTKGVRVLPNCVPTDLRDFIALLMERDPARRPSPTEALRLPFLAGLQLNGTVRQLLWKHRKRLPNAEEGDNYFPPLRICWALTPAGLAFRRANHDLVKYLANSGRRPSWCGTHLMAEESKDSGKWMRQDIDRVRADMEAARQEASQQRDDADD
ncbi:hypothetical protein GPECTOR_7g1256 [Gonium pectorale]|uniref:Protein kinase domain-containing protein n=1 Tax=Gonium pectorale TaxID=33097 RepID=A0A150GVI7_GONPE|nr:hypothetical protein GPECTOR_7g1256 [Gonium pectorale]|eukprot:KXZ53360.1 hypothetical protein GPECTOR_7g1256 [Gonium pectorale]